MARPRQWGEKASRISITVSPAQKAAYDKFQQDHAGEFSEIMRPVLDIIFASQGVIDIQKIRKSVVESTIERIEIETRIKLDLLKEELSHIGEIEDQCSKTDSLVEENRRELLQVVKRRPEFWNGPAGYRYFEQWIQGPSWSNEIIACKFNTLVEAWEWFKAEAVKEAGQ